jgi:hypothetical protein
VGNELCPEARKFSEPVLQSVDRLRLRTRRFGAPLTNVAAQFRPVALLHPGRQARTHHPLSWDDHFIRTIAGIPLGVHRGQE